MGGARYPIYKASDLIVMKPVTSAGFV